MSKPLFRLPPVHHVAMMIVGAGSPVILAITRADSGPGSLDLTSPLAISGLAIAAVAAVMASAHTLLVPIAALVAGAIAGATGAVDWGFGFASIAIAGGAAFNVYRRRVQDQPHT
jgi:hypothetical protein